MLVRNSLHVIHFTAFGFLRLEYVKIETSDEVDELFGN